MFDRLKTIVFTSVKLDCDKVLTGAIIPAQNIELRNLLSSTYLI